MSKQFRFYLLPSDTEHLFAYLRTRIAFRLLEDKTPTIAPIELQAPPNTESTFGSRCYLADAKGADIKLSHYPTQSAWLIQIESEVIECDTCGFDGEVLRQGRMYFQTDFLVGEHIFPKRPEFIAWGDRLFRYAKQFLRRDAALDAYVGQDADAFRKSGGIFRQF